MGASRSSPPFQDQDRARRRCPATDRVRSPNACDQSPQPHSGSSRSARRSQPRRSGRTGSKSPQRQDRLAPRRVHEHTTQKLPTGRRKSQRHRFARPLPSASARPPPARTDRVLVKQDVKRVRVDPEGRLGTVSIIEHAVEHHHPLDAGDRASRPAATAASFTRQNPIAEAARAHSNPQAGQGRGPPRPRPPARRRPPPFRPPRRRPHNRSCAHSPQCRGRSHLRPTPARLPVHNQILARVRRARGSASRRRAGLLDGRMRRPYGVHHRIHPGRPLRVRPRIVQAEQVGHVTGERSRL